MKDTLTTGLEACRRIEVDEGRTISFIDDDCKVYATPFVIYDMEVCSRDLIKGHLDEQEDTVGISVSMQHLAATPLGMWAEIHVRIEKIDGRKVTLAFSGKDAGGDIARGTHERFIVDTRKTAEQIRSKSAKYTG